MRIYWKKEFDSYADSSGIKHLRRITCPKCGAFWVRQYFANINDIAFAQLFIYCPDCGHKNIETEQDIKDREKALEGFRAYWAHYNEEC